MNIREVRKALKMSQTEFGQALGVNYITVLNWEKGIEPIKKNLDAIRDLAMQNGLTFEPPAKYKRNNQTIHTTKTREDTD